MGPRDSREWVTYQAREGCEQVWGWERTLLSEHGDSQGANRFDYIEHSN